MSDLVNVLVSDLNDALGGSIDYDLQIVIGEAPNSKTFPAHSFILRARSPYFNSILSTTQKNEVDGKVNIKTPSITPDVFSIILNYFYTGTVSWETMKRNNIASILASAQEFQLSDLTDYIQKELIANHETYIHYHLVDLYKTSFTLKSCQDLYKYCEAAIAANPKVLSEAQVFNKLEHESLKSLLMQNGLAMTEIEIWNNVIAWGIANTAELTTNVDFWTKADFQKLGNTLADLLPFIRYVSINSTDFYHRVLPYKKIFPKKLFQEILQHYLDSDYNFSKGNLQPARQSATQQFDSVLVNNQQMNWIIDQIKNIRKELFQGLEEKHVEMNLLYRGTRDDFTPGDFHLHCDSKEDTVTVVRNADTAELLGGYSPLCWNLENNSVHSTKSFIFAFGDHDLDSAVFSEVQDPRNAIYCDLWCGPCFGMSDLEIGNTTGNAFNEKDQCKAEQKHYYLPLRSTSDKFTIDEIEVFQIQVT